MIERVETAYYRIPLPEAMGDAMRPTMDSEELITVKVYADGLIGHGYAYTPGRGGKAIQVVIEQDLAPVLIGRDARAVDKLWHTMWRSVHYVGRGGLTSFAIAALDIALWDLRGLREGRPLYDLAGGTAQDIPAYGSGVDLDKPLSYLLKQTEGFLERGFLGVKMKIGRPDPDEEEQRVAAVRRLIGDGVDLMLDANMAWTVEEGIARMGRLGAYNPFWFEEPTVPEDVAGHRQLADALAVPIATGENLHSPEEYRRYVEAGAIEVLQIDPVTNGGITASLQALAMADVAGLATSSHYTDELSAHLLCTSRKPLYVEKHAFALDPYLLEPQEVVGGRVRPTEVPGTGMRFDEEALSRYAEG